MVFVRDRCAEEGHDAVARVLVHSSLEAVNAVSKDPEEAIHDSVPLFGTQLRGELHRSFHVGEEHRHLLALAFEGAARSQDLFGEMFRSVGERIGRWPRLRGLSERLCAFSAEKLARLILCSA
jgi:hypothetical protein